MADDHGGVSLHTGALAAAFDLLEGGVVLLDEGQHVLTWNSWTETASGIVAASARGRKLRDVFPALRATRLPAAISDALISGTASILTHALNPGLLPLRLADGRPLLHNVMVRAASCGENRICIVQILDVTLAFERERTLRERQDAKYRAVVDTAADAIVTTALDGKVQWANAAAARLLGRSVEDLVGRDIGEIIDHGGAWPVGTIDWAASHQHGPAEVVGLLPSGGTVPMELSVAGWKSDGRSFVTGIARDVTDRRRAESAQQTLIAELQHRTRNLLAIVQSLSNQAQQTSSTLEDYSRRFNARLAALGRVQKILARGEGQYVSFRSLIEDELQAHGSSAADDHVVIGGPDVGISSKAVQVLMLALHELATNAVKYGALSQDQARLSITWHVLEEGGRRSLDIRWEETGVELQPGETGAGYGFGRQLIERALPYDLGAESRWHLASGGVLCEFRLSAGWVPSCTDIA